MSRTLHYFFDPLCGWCYGAAPLLDAASRVPGLTLNLRAGGLWPEPVTLPADMRAYIRAADARVGQMTGQPYGEAYLHGWLDDPNGLLDSRPPIAAWLAVQAIAPDRAVAMVHAIQRAHYVDGRRVVEPDVLADIAASVGVDRERYAGEFAAADVDAHVTATRREMARLGVHGFPTAFLERGGALEPLSVQSFYGNPEGFAAALAA